MADLAVWLDEHQPESLLMRQLTARFGEVDSQLRERVQSLSLAQLRELSEALLDFETVTDLANWLDEHQLGENGDSEALLCSRSVSDRKSADRTSLPNS